MADRPCADLGGKTCLQAARRRTSIVCNDWTGWHGAHGAAGLPAGQRRCQPVGDGLRPRRYYTGRSPLEAASIGVQLSPDDVAYRCNLVTPQDRRSGPADSRRMKTLMEDFSAGHISTQEARTLIEEIDSRLGTERIRFYPGVSYRHLMVWKGGKDKIECTPPMTSRTGRFMDYLPGAKAVTSSTA